MVQICVTTHIYEGGIGLKRAVMNLSKNLGSKGMDELFNKMADFFNVLSESTRLRIMYAVCGGEKSVGEVVEHCGSSQANVSRQLSALYKAGILNRRKVGATVYYSIADKSTVDMCQIVCAKMAKDLH
jgi:DNA-binding transcriptional ArsR family regulator